ncbi:MAG: hypothetical protein JXR77_05490 [Lentisphaeria bacterium]|nr:hypothetical protein [Lentisphaeria bacterium]
MTEYDLIRRLTRNLRRSPRQRNALFECDAELVQLSGGLWALSIDEFSAAEDLFGRDDPVLLGRNLAVATLADLLAAGAQPRFMLQALALPRNTAPDVFDGIMEGLTAILDAAECCLLGGDLGTTAEDWRFTGCAMGPVPGGRPLTRRLADAPQILWVSGPLGDANLAAVQTRHTPPFEFRGDTAAVIRRFATACIDTSGGLADALWMLHRQSPGIELRIDLDTLPLAPETAEFAQQAGIPAETFLLGGAGEYELLFAIPADLPPAAESELLALGAVPIGRAQPDSPAGVLFARSGRPLGRLAEPPPCPRAAPSTEDHIRDVIRLGQTLFGDPHA